MKGNFICSICGKDYNDLNNYVNCVSTCYKKKIKEKEIKDVLNELEHIKYLYEQKLEEFKEKYPKEYELNFASEGCICPSDCKGYCSDEDDTEDNTEDFSKLTKDNNMESMEFSYESNGKDKPKLSAKVNGKKVDDNRIEELFKDPDIKYLAKLLGIL